jgi:hypothetical protein
MHKPLPIHPLYLQSHSHPISHGFVCVKIQKEIWENKETIKKVVKESREDRHNIQNTIKKDVAEGF